jgi:phage gpG-like protein
MPFDIRFDVSGDVQVSRRLDRMQQKAKDLSSAFEKMHDSFLSIERKQFDTQGASGSGGWAPIKAKTLAFKASRQLDPRILHMKLRMRKSLTNKTSPDHVAKITPHEAFFGTSVPYAAVHQNPKPSNPMPRRRVVELTESQRRAWARIIQKEIVDA